MNNYTKIKFSDGTFAFRDNDTGVVYYNNGRMKDKNGKMSNYDDPSIKKLFEPKTSQNKSSSFQQEALRRASIPFGPGAQAYYISAPPKVDVVEYDNSDYGKRNNAGQALGAVASVPIAATVFAAPEFIPKVLTNPYVQAGMNSLWITDLTQRAANGTLGSGITGLAQGKVDANNLVTDAFDLMGVPSLTRGAAKLYYKAKPIAKAVSNTVKSVKPLARDVWSIARNNMTKGNARLAYPWENTSGSIVEVSELDWSPESWFSKRPGNLGLPYNSKTNPMGYTDFDVRSLKSHIPEYIKIEMDSKANGTWLKMPDGSTWTGDPRSWVQLMSKNGQRLSGERLFSGIPKEIDFNPEYTGEVWADKERLMSSYWSGEDLVRPGFVFELTPAKGKRFVVDAKGHGWNDIPIKQNGITLPIAKDWKAAITDDVVDYAISNGYNTTQINNVVEGSGDLVTDVVVHPNFARKALLGNNGNFNFSNKNLFRVLMPFGITIGGLKTGKDNFKTKTNKL